MTKTVNSTKSNDKANSRFRMISSNIFGKLGRIGKALLFPIAVLPIAAILLRVGAEIPTGTAFAKFVQSVIFGAGNVVFDNLPIIFAVGIGFGLTKDNRGEAALSALIGMLVLMALMKTGSTDLPDQIWKKTFDFHALFLDKYDKILAGNVLNGIFAGSIVAYLYNRFNGVELPKVLGFFSGRRLIPVLAILSMAFFTIFYAIVFPWVGWVLSKFSNALSDGASNQWSKSAISGIYVVLNRLLIPFGLHHVPNTLFWFQFGEHVTDTGLPVYGDINIFLTGAALGNHSGAFQTGFFPMMMFGLPALVAAMYVTADNKEQKRQVIALMGGSALVAFLTGITEPIEFTFLFASPLLYGIHAVLGGIFAFITGLFGIQLGFGFSAGLFDYLLSIPKATEIIDVNLTGIQAVMANPGWLVVIGGFTAATYFFVGKWSIKRFNIQTPGRGTNQIVTTKEPQVSGGAGVATPVNLVQDAQRIKAQRIVEGLGGYDNITNFQNCTTRLRYDVIDSAKVDEKALKEAGALGVIKVSKTHVHVIIGTSVEILNNMIIEHRPVKNNN